MKTPILDWSLTKRTFVACTLAACFLSTSAGCSSGYEGRRLRLEVATTARALIRLYQSVLDSEETFGDLTGRYSAMLPIQREIKIMITQLVNLIHIIQHPEEAPPDT